MISLVCTALAATEPEEPSSLTFFGGPLVGAAVVDRDRSLVNGGRGGFSLGARVGLAFTLPRLSQGSGRFSLMPAFEVRHDFGAPHTDGFGSMTLGVRFIEWLRMTMGLAYGVSSLVAPMPQHVFGISMGLGAKVGPVWLSAETDIVFRLTVTDARTMRVMASAMFEHELFSG